MIRVLAFVLHKHLKVISFDISKIKPIQDESVSVSRVEHGTTTPLPHTSYWISAIQDFKNVILISHNK